MTSTQVLETLAHFSRERIPERAVHAKASGARGYFEVTDDVSDITDADFFNGIGKRTECLVRIATTGPKAGSADTVRDFRGFAMKFKTAEGNQDFVFNNQASTVSSCVNFYADYDIYSQYFLFETQSNSHPSTAVTSQTQRQTDQAQTCSGIFM